MQLTKKQQIIYDFICTFTEDNGYAPSIREICDGVGLKSTATVHNHIQNLKSLGVLDKTSMKNRALSIVKQEEEDDDEEERKIEKEGCLADIEICPDQEIANVPVIGNVAAGQPIFATENFERTFPLPMDMVGNDETFMLKVKGESMINVGIFDGDYIIVRRQPTAHNGDIIVALIEDEATVKTYYKEKDYFRLQPENDYMQPIIATEITVLGKVTGLIRKF